MDLNEKEFEKHTIDAIKKITKSAGIVVKHETAKILARLAYNKLYNDTSSVIMEAKRDFCLGDLNLVKAKYVQIKKSPNKNLSIDEQLKYYMKNSHKLFIERHVFKAFFDAQFSYISLNYPPYEKGFLDAFQYSIEQYIRDYITEYETYYDNLNYDNLI